MTQALTSTGLLALAVAIVTGAGFSDRQTPVQPAVPRAISGRVTNADGVPLARIQLGAGRRTVRDGVATWTWGSGAATTGDDGRYQMTGVAPGEYYIVASAYRANPTTRVSEPQVPDAVIERGGARLGYVTTAYRFEGAPTRTLTAVRVVAADVGGIDIQLQRRPVFEVRGIVTGGVADELPPTVVLLMMPQDADTIPFGRQAALAGGRFVATDLPDGRYEVLVHVRPMPARATVIIAGRSPSPVSIVIGSQR